MKTFTREQSWRKNYRENRDLDHLTESQLGDRFVDCINNQAILTERNKLGISNPQEDDGRWLQLQTEVMEECLLRQCHPPNPIDGAKLKAAIFNASNPAPNAMSAINKWGLGSRPYLLKFGDPVWLTEFFESGMVRVSSASYYDSTDHNHARRDTERSRTVYPHPANPNIPQFLKSIGQTLCEGEVCSRVVIESPTDYYLYSLSMKYSQRLFHDFNSTACLVIHDPLCFLSRLGLGVTAHLGEGWAHSIGWVSYYDAVRVNPASIEVTHYKPFSHAYQREMRLTWLSPEVGSSMKPFFVEIGSLSDCAELVTLESHPPEAHPKEAITMIVDKAHQGNVAKYNADTAQ
jgi:hypothetical protein